MAEEVDKEAQEIVKKYDLDDSKFLELNEIRILLKYISSEADVPCPVDKEINQIFKDYDLNGDGLISLTEFIHMWKDLKKIKSGGQQEVTYTVKSGDTLYGICEELGVTLSELKKMNPKIKETMTLHVGDKFVTQQ